MGPSFLGKYLAIAAAIIALVLIGYSWSMKITDADWQKAAFAIWAIGVPSWFLFEYWKFGPSSVDARAEFRHYQELSRYVWFGVGIVMMVVFFGIP